MKRIEIVLTCLVFLLLITTFTVFPALAQTNGRVVLALHKVFGFKSFGNQQIRVQGTLALAADASANVARVIFYIDEIPMGEDSQPPFRLQFDSDAYPLGAHTFSSVGFTTDGRQIQSNHLVATFVTSGEAWRFGLQLIIPVVVIALLALGISLLARRKLVKLPAGAPRIYGVSGGAICPRCNRPFPLHILAPDLFGRKVERCPYCGRIGLVRRMSTGELKAAEAAELMTSAETGNLLHESDDEKLKRDLDAAKYIKF